MFILYTEYDCPAKTPQHILSLFFHVPFPPVDGKDDINVHDRKTREPENALMLVDFSLEISRSIKPDKP